MPRQISIQMRNCPADHRKFAIRRRVARSDDEASALLRSQEPQVYGDALQKGGCPIFSVPRAAAIQRIDAGQQERSHQSIQALLGHEDRKTTEFYLENVRSAERQAVNILEQATLDFGRDPISELPSPQGNGGTNHRTDENKSHRVTHRGESNQDAGWEQSP
jgi:hypothetical protein